MLHFDPAWLTPGPGLPFMLYVTCTSADAEGRRLLLSDGSDELETFAQIDADFNVQGEGSAERWQDVDELEVRIMFGTAH